MIGRKLWTWSIEDGSLFNDPDGDLVLLEDANAAIEAEREKHHTHYCCDVCDYHVMPHRRCILR
jgi:hypothetical protein